MLVSARHCLRFQSFEVNKMYNYMTIFRGFRSGDNLLVKMASSPLLEFCSTLFSSRHFQRNAMCNPEPQKAAEHRPRGLSK